MDSTSRTVRAGKTVSLKALWNHYKRLSPGDLINSIESYYMKKRARFVSIVSSSTILLIICKTVSLFSYYFYIFIPVLFMRLSLNYWILVIHIIVKRSTHARNIYLHLVALFAELSNGFNKFMSMTLDDIVKMIQQTYLEVRNSSNQPSHKTLSLSEIAELISYEEEQDDRIGESKDKLGNNFMEHYMHQYVPPRLFKATVRVRSSSSSSNVPIAENMIEGPESDWFVQTPVSLPTTPSSRSRVMCRNCENVSSTMFAARDKLRMALLSMSDDEVSREHAMIAQKYGMSAAFDYHSKVEGLVLTCGNHCASKTGRSLCCNARAMIPILTNTHTYFEFSITAASGVSPCISIGFGTTECPSNAMVGSWPGSVGIYSDGQLLLEGQWIQGSEAPKIAPGSTVGVLVYIPSDLSAETPIVVLNIDGKLVDHDIDIPLLRTMFARECQTSSKTEIGYESNNLTSGNRYDYYPTVSILSEGTKVWCRFCEADVLEADREAIGAPSGVRIYCLDGSILLHEDEE